MNSNYDFHEIALNHNVINAMAAVKNNKLAIANMWFSFSSYMPFFLIQLSTKANSIQTVSKLISIARELSPQGVHVCHIIIDGLIYNSRTRQLNPDLDSDRYIRMSSLVELVNYIISQKKDCWTHEIDLRPYNESF